MKRFILINSLVAFVLLSLWVFASEIQAQGMQLKPCPDQQGTRWQCGYVVTPLNHFNKRDKRKMMIYVKVWRGSGDHKQAMMYVDGGPGGTPIDDYWPGLLRSLIGDNLEGRDMVFFDPRGGGQSGLKTRSGPRPLKCRAFEKATQFDKNYVALMSRCMKQVGPTRAYYATPQHAHDMEAVRRHLGYEKLALYGISYGTKVSLQYARSFPAATSQLILDSTVDDPGPFDLESFRALAPVLNSYCLNNACSQITDNPVADLNWAVAELQKKPLEGAVNGSDNGWRMTVDDLWYMLLTFDFAPSYRGELIAALARFRGGNPDALLRLSSSIGFGEVSNPSESEEPYYPLANDSSFNNVLFEAQVCRDVNWPWRRQDSIKTRQRKLLAAAKSSQRPGDWSAETIYRYSNDGYSCAGMPEAAGRAPIGAPPQVDTLLIAGEQDLRTPIELAAGLSQRMPSRLQTVRAVGHAVLLSESLFCGERALNAFVLSAPAPGCVGDDTMTVRPLPRASVADYPENQQLSGPEGQTVSAIKDNLVDVASMINTQSYLFDANYDGYYPINGLEYGQVEIEGSAPDSFGVNFARGASLSRFSSTRGIQLSGKLDRDRQGHLSGTLKVNGRINGVVYLEDNQMSGELNDRSFVVSSPDWPQWTSNSTLSAWAQRQAARRIHR